MKKHIRYIIDSITCHFSSSFQFSPKTKSKWLRYSIDSSNIVELNECQVSHCSFNIHGVGNRIIIDNGANVCYCGFNITGNNNTIQLDGCTGIMSLTLRGDRHNVTIGKDTSMESVYMICMGQNNRITIGEDCMFSGGIELWNSDTHLITDLDGNPTNPSKPITIGNHVWIGKNVKILKGVTIGDNSIIGMDTVVTRNVPVHSIAAGNPARVVREGNADWCKGFIKI